MSKFPFNGTDIEPFNRNVSKALVARDHTETAVYLHALRARYAAEVDRIDSEALATALSYSLEAECALFDHGARLAGNSPAKAELVAAKIELAAGINNSRIRRRFSS